MKNILEKIKGFFENHYSQSRVSDVEEIVRSYLDESIDIVDLKRRMEILKSKGFL